MKKTCLFLLIGCLFGPSITAQISMKDFKPFIDDYTIVDTLINGSNKNPEEILLILSDGEQDDNQRMLLLRNIKGSLTKIAENDDLIMNPSMLGVSGSNYTSFDNNAIYVAYTLGSGSGYSNVSIQFEKNKNDGNYYFSEYDIITYNYGVENLFARQKITSSQTGEIKFSEANENLIFEKYKANSLAQDATEPISKAAERFAKYIPEDYRLAVFSEGDLNMDDFKKDLLLILYGETCRIQLLLQQKDGSYKPSSANDYLISTDETFNINNLKAVIKNGYFTIEQRVASDDGYFDHRYITFKYDAKTKNWLLHRYDVEHYSGFNTKPSADVIHLTKQNFGDILFKDLDNTTKY